MVANSTEGPQREIWDNDQRLVITADSDARLIVDAGPGTGKTAVACARLAHLIAKEDREPSKIWMFSFTRTAVAEIRSRLHSYVGKASFAIRIATVDSHAWSIHSGHDPSAKLTGTYEENIDRVIELLTTDSDVADELAQIEHVVIDEAQDLVGTRASLIEALVARLPSDCGITVFADEAQAIYDFSDDNFGGQTSSSSTSNTSLLDRLRAAKVLRFDSRILTKIYRTSSPGLQKIFSDVRQDILNSQKHCSGFHAVTAERIREYADADGLKANTLNLGEYGSDDLVLFRTRAEVLSASQFCRIPHRLRLSGYGTTLPAWLAICFADFVEPYLGERDFLDRWTHRLADVEALPYGPTDAWHRLMRVAGRKDGSLDMRRLRERLSQPRSSVDLTLPEFGTHGPIIGTVHASKGREASRVTFLLPKGAEFESVESELEESRVLFVGATRARTSLRVGESNSNRASTLQSGRVYRSVRKGQAIMVEVGREGDITSRGLVGRKELTAADASASQALLARAANAVTTFTLESDPDMEWRYRIYAGEERLCVGALSRNLTLDVWDILARRGKNQSHRPPKYVNYVNSQGCGSIVISADDKDLGLLNEPWASSGFVLAPRIVAFPTLSLSRRT